MTDFLRERGQTLDVKFTTRKNGDVKECMSLGLYGSIENENNVNSNPFDEELQKLINVKSLLKGSHYILYG